MTDVPSLAMDVVIPSQREPRSRSDDRQTAQLSEFAPRVDTRICVVSRLGLVPYLSTWELQRRLASARRESHDVDRLLLVEHPHSYTLGRRGRHEDVLITPEEQRRLDVRVYETDRGGEVTYHGPGQLVAYPILKLEGPQRDVRQYMRNLEEVIMLTLSTFGITGSRITGLTGVWVGDDKVAAVGARIASWVTTHGFALNVNTDLTYFSHIIPCGIKDRGVTSVARLVGHPLDMLAVEDSVIAAFGTVFKMAMKDVATDATLDHERPVAVEREA